MREFPGFVNNQFLYNLWTIVPYLDAFCKVTLSPQSKSWPLIVALIVVDGHAPTWRRTEHLGLADGKDLRWIIEGAM